MALECTREQLQPLAGMPASEFMLHRKPMLLLDKLVEIGPQHAVCEWLVRPDDAFVSDGLGVPAYIGIEYMAQCVAVHAGACERVHGFPPPMGMLLGARDFKISEAYLKVGQVYQTRCEEVIRGADGVAAFMCNITYEDHLIVNTRLSVWQLERGNELNG